MSEKTDHSFSSLQAFSAYLKHPENIAVSDEKNISSLSERFPYAQSLHALQAKAHQDSDNFERYLSTAALYAPDREALYHLIYKPEKLVVKQEATSGTAAGQDLDNAAGSNVIAAQSGDLDMLENKTTGYPAEGAADPEGESTELGFEEILADEATEPDFVDIEEEFMIIADPADEQPAAEIEIETLIPDLEIEPGEDPLAESSAQPTEKRSDETEKQIISNIASSDFFRFEEKIDDRLTGQIHPERTVEREQSKTDNGGVSKYDDDTMPYTFRWWLHKTRKEHADTYQPYVNFKLDTTEQIKKETAPVLNQQIIENIFHLQSPLDDIPEKPKPQTVEFTLKRKDDQIIERFIREEPQIRPPQPEKLDTENKARKSSEDSYDMVSETLAQVYIEQMLFSKAIDTYKKLSLKFPEKSAYFADQIRKLETTNKD